MRRSSVFLLLLLVLVLAFGFQGSRGIFSPDECFYVAVGQAMSETGDLLIPRLDHVPWLDKPPLSLWGIAGGLWLLGQNEWGARAFHGLCFALTALLVYVLGKSMAGERQGFLSAAIYATMALPFAAGNIVTPDTPLTFWTTLSFLCFWNSVRPGARRVALWKMLMCVAFGLGFLTKGPAALLPAGAMFVFLVARGNAWRYFLTSWALPGILLFALIGLSWYVYIAEMVFGALDYMIDNQLIGRTISSKYARNPGLAGALIYPPTVLLGALPWSLFWFVALWRGRAALLRRNGWRRVREDPARLLLLTWIGVVLLALAAASSKLSLYALPVFPALALATARLFPARVGMAAGPQAFGFPRRAVVALAIWGVVMLSLRFGASVYPQMRDMRALHGAIQKHMPCGPCEVVAVQEHLDGLGFYMSQDVERVTTSNRPYPFFVLPEALEEEVGELATSRYAHLFICRKEPRAEELRMLLREQNLEFTEAELPFRRTLFSVPPGRMAAPLTVRLLALGDVGSGKGKSRERVLADVLRRVCGENGCDGLLLLGDNVKFGKSEAKDPAAVVRDQVEIPFQPLTDLGVPIYAALGNHDDDHDCGMTEFQTHCPLLHMGGRRYYSKSFGDGLVEAFFLDSNTVVDEDGRPDVPQVEWLRDALARSGARWKIAILHHPLRTTAHRHHPNPHMGALLYPIFSAHGVSLLLHGHNHLYQRLKPVGGVAAVTAGSGGRVDEGDLVVDAPERVVGNDTRQVFVALEFTPDECHVTARDMFFQIVDEFTLSPPVSAD